MDGSNTVGHAGVLGEVSREREKQDAKWGRQNHPPFTWLAILGEEVGEANQAAVDAHDFSTKEYNPYLLELYREELIQVAAVAVAMVECLDRGDWVQLSLIPPMNPKFKAKGIVESFMNLLGPEKAGT